MAVTINAPEQVAARTWRVSWSSSLPTPTFWVYRDGELATITQQTSILLFAEAGESVVIDVVDDEDDVLPVVFPGRATLSWTAVANAAGYRVEEYIGAAWVVRTTVYDRGEACFTWSSRCLEDGATHQFRVVPVGANGNDGTPLTFSLLMARHPDVPDVDWSYDDGTGVATISEV